MIKIKQAVIVEGKYDKIKLESIIDALIITTEGFEIFKDSEKMSMIRRLSETNGILIMTDSDVAGFKIRSYISGCVDPKNIYHAYIPDILGKEPRKEKSSKEGKLGVEGIPTRLIVEALERAGVMCAESEQKRGYMTKVRLYEDGLSGGGNSANLRKALLKKLGLPERLSANSLVKVINESVSEGEYISALESARDEIK
ncbi:MAG: DUF4093 domain-containing protein [Clostridia bacterium]|nr:DUF4093 domain-containing protein [Clostridia bacterium]